MSRCEVGLTEVWQERKLGVYHRQLVGHHPLRPSHLLPGLQAVGNDAGHCSLLGYSAGLLKHQDPEIH